jgi:predicted transcriptional regulator YheO
MSESTVIIKEMQNEIVEILCINCNNNILIYQKDRVEDAELHRCYCDRIINKDTMNCKLVEFRQIISIYCKSCNSKFGELINYEKHGEKRLVFELQLNKFLSNN